MQLPEPPQEVE
ncbi:hypothetical protein LLG28_17270 [Salmonella enterica]|nr:hypothetical protein [Salmonella enterica]